MRCWPTTDVVSQVRGDGLFTQYKPDDPRPGLLASTRLTSVRRRRRVHGGRSVEVEMLWIIAPDEFRGDSERLARHKESTGILTSVRTQMGLWLLQLG
jgi:hypothetical protein